MDLFSFFYIQSVSPAPFTEDALFFPLYIFDFFAHKCVGLFWVFNSIPLIDLSVSVSIPCSFYHYCSVVQLEVRDDDSPRSSFIFKNCFRISLSICLKNCVGILIGSELNLQNAFGRIALFTLLILPIHKHGRSLHFLRSSLISFLRDLKLLPQKSFRCLVTYSKIFYIICV